ncbi:hypothetical protein BST81_08150 [Leptolyngbya sp. 'hensonii']|uniref:sigma-70 family RNA polymerase sigma factor n=1 Tax=Leptolyngbya sp. 'hensonii' TaxID=1922337 RepID=UPI00094F69AB|nr:sigma-70 family RNA polymerase sigma factor [Leptolyngbya sp. 'hensonii']OLP18878.1 hypothetical protein BST81_08150 [Leptolyngbya sp. 'hensonii']
MHPRSDLIELFSTFLRFDQAGSHVWGTDPVLRRSMQICLDQYGPCPDRAASTSPEDAEQFWVLYWHRRWQHQSERLAMAHLSAYLQETCYWSASRMTRQFASPIHHLADYFQMAITDLPKILDHCQPEHLAGLKAYAWVVFSNRIRDTLRRQREIDLCSDWGLLLKLSRKRLQEALAQRGLSDSEMQRYLLAWRCFTDLYIPATPGLNRLASPTPDLWAAIARCYNQRQKTQLPGSEVDRSPQDLAAWLADCARHIRAYFYPVVTSLSQSRPEEMTTEWEVVLPDAVTASPLDLAIVQEELRERQEQWGQISQILRTAIAQLDAANLQLVEMYYGQSLTQQQIATALGIPQYTVSRKLARVREALLSALARWSQETLHILPTSTVIKSMSVMLEEWLQVYCQPPDR